MRENLRDLTILICGVKSKITEALEHVLYCTEGYIIDYADYTAEDLNDTRKGKYDLILFVINDFRVDKEFLIKQQVFNHETPWIVLGDIDEETVVPDLQRIGIFHYCTLPSFHKNLIPKIRTLVA